MTKQQEVIAFLIVTACAIALMMGGLEREEPPAVVAGIVFGCMAALFPLVWIVDALRVMFHKRSKGG